MAGSDAVSEERYSRQVAVPEVGQEGQSRLGAARVAVIGAGGLGAPVLQYLVGAGLGRIDLLDPDWVDRSNLHRQTLFREGDIGAAKAEAAARHMAGLNPECEVVARSESFDPETAPDVVAGADLVLDCADSLAASYIASDVCAAGGVPLIQASVTGLSGYACGVCAVAPSLRAVFPEPPGRMGNCATEGVLGPVVGVLGALQAQMAIAVLLGHTPSPLGRLISVDAAGLRFGGFRFDGTPEPAEAPGFVAPGSITDADFVVDLRAPDEAPLIRPEAHRLPISAFGPGGPAPVPGQRAVMCCRSGLRSWQAASRLRAAWDGEIALVAAGDPSAT